MVQSEAKMCHTKSKKFRGRCFVKKQNYNCKLICKREHFITGQCSRGSCLCLKKCGAAPPPLPPPPPPTDDDGDDGGDDGDSGDDNAGEIATRR